MNTRYRLNPPVDWRILIDLISSPLLLYRITANFGAPPYREDDVYKCA
jgi:hypothetical protein